jgi:threonine dehydrogenase-like Zn-dependent dehydrogenase
MRALVSEPGQRIRLADVALPRRPRECLIRVRLAGICGTDLQILQGYAAFAGIPGHEFVGVVEEVASRDDERWLGQRVVGEINVGCGTCDWCSGGVKEHCQDRTVLGIRARSGAFAEFVSLPASNLVPVPGDMADDVAVFAEPAAAACRILGQIALPSDIRVAVVGDGRLGLLVTQVLLRAPSRVTLFGRHPEKLAVARGLGIADTHTGVRAEFDRSFDVVVDVTGRPSGFADAVRLVRPRGTVVLKSTFHDHDGPALSPVVVGEITVVGSRCGPVRPALALLSSGTVRVEPLIDRILPLDAFEEAFAAARTSLKVLFRPGEEG